eukprot:CAMPEP_0202688848 /NCGR_PEP_ID=MMETSP1385-20130828/4253_1 /ASSEMBLY_ACC=CAM_ASM_000861 /TAXON_ID=933848 /ORGANISM="Elphidium margaritaceum" /LENGTH=474 /DNA_ID=CAMNT_0049343899 /DNA_START=68 /DNA_END=1492 /DNA_ORIENTATION=+
MPKRYNASELANACNLTQQEAEECINQYDPDGDGLLDEDEFAGLRDQILAQQQDVAANNINANDTHASIDADGDGRVTATELANACNMTEMEAQNVILQYDEDGDGTLSVQEFNDLKTQILAQQRAAMTDKMDANTFHDEVDADGDGRVTAAELANACNLTEMEAQNIILQYDADGDGTLSMQEFQDLKEQVLAQQRAAMTDKIGTDDTFAQMDKDASQRLTATELAAACNISESQAKNVIAQYDVNGDGKLDEKEFETLKQQILKQQKEKAGNTIAADTSLADLDDNKDNRLSAAEFAQATGISEKEAQSLIAGVDKNGDGYLNKKEFEALKQQIEKRKAEQERLKRIKEERQQRQAEQQQQYQENQKQQQNPSADDAVQEFKHKWKFGMNFDPKNENIVIYVSDEISARNWGTTLTKNDVTGPIRQEYRKLGAVISSATIKYDFPKDNGQPLGVHIIGKNDEKYSYKCPELQ